MFEIEIGVSRWIINSETLVGMCIAGEEEGVVRQFSKEEFEKLLNPRQIPEDSSGFWN